MENKFEIFIFNQNILSCRFFNIAEYVHVRIRKEGLI